MASKFSHGPWSVRATPNKQWKFEVRNTHRDPIAIIYTTQADAELMAAAPKLLGELKHLIAIVRLHEGDLRASAKASLERARALVNQLNGGN